MSKPFSAQEQQLCTNFFYEKCVGIPTIKRPYQSYAWMVWSDFRKFIPKRNKPQWSHKLFTMRPIQFLFRRGLFASHMFHKLTEIWITHPYDIWAITFLISKLVYSEKASPVLLQSSSWRATLRGWTWRSPSSPPSPRTQTCRQASGWSPTWRRSGKPGSRKLNAIL